MHDSNQSDSAPEKKGPCLSVMQIATEISDVGLSWTAPKAHLCIFQAIVSSFTTSETTSCEVKVRPGVESGFDRHFANWKRPIVVVSLRVFIQRKDD